MFPTATPIDDNPRAKGLSLTKYTLITTALGTKAKPKPKPNDIIFKLILFWRILTQPLILDVKISILARSGILSKQDRKR